LYAHKKTAVFFLILMAAWSFLTFPAQGLAENAKGAAVMEARSGRILFSKEGTARLPMASTTKLMTALITLEQPDLDLYFTVDPQAIRVEGSSMGLQAGDQVTLRALAWGMMLASGNDAAGAAAVRIAGSLENFAMMMNAKALMLGMADSHFVTPSGLHSPDHYTTAEDMAKLARAALQNELLAEMALAKNQKLEYGNPPYPRWLQNHNRLLWNCPGAIGLKTGYTDAAGRCLVSAARREDVTLIVVTLGCPDDFNMHEKLYDEYFAQIAQKDFGRVLEGLTVAVTGAAQSRLPVRVAEPLAAAVRQGEQPEVRLELPRFVYAPVAEGDRVGWASVSLDGETILRLPLLAAAQAPALYDPDLQKNLWQRIAEWFD
jgi:D-alanyl-D-alanine carboxypeptidase/D-alanyl-D-alanine carboxypeptidase (penicillin-binding protein 5/6)